MGTVWFLVNNYLGVRTVSISDRLKEERELTGFSQTKFGQMGGVTKKTQMLYESGERAPDAVYLRGVAQIGVDVQYVLTGLRSKNLDELMLTDEFVSETARERGKWLGGLPLAPQIPVVRKAHKFVSHMLAMMASGQLQEADVDVLDGMAARLARPPAEAANENAEAGHPPNAVMLDTDYKGKRTGPQILGEEHTGRRTGPAVVGKEATVAKKRRKGEAP